MSALGTGPGAGTQGAPRDARAARPGSLPRGPNLSMLEATPRARRRHPAPHREARRRTVRPDTAWETRRPHREGIEATPMSFPAASPTLPS